MMGQQGMPPPGPGTAIATASSSSSSTAPTPAGASAGARRSLDSTINGAVGSGSGSKAGQAQQDAEEAKRRKIQRACDACRRKKIKCDGPMNSLSTSTDTHVPECAHCQEYGLECTYVEAAKRRGPPKGYIEALEQRCGRLERLFHQLQPGIDMTEYIGPPLDREDFDQSNYNESLAALHIPAYPQIKTFLHPLSKSSSLPNSASHNSPSSAISSPAAGPPSSATTVLGPTPWKTYERDPSRPPDDSDSNLDIDPHEHAQMAEAMNRLNIHDGSWRFHGKSSLAHLIRQFNNLKYKQEEGPTAFLERVAEAKRSEYWHVPEWEVVVANEGVRPVDYSIWPAQGLDKRLIDAYFDQVNTYLPLLNRIIFMRQYDAGTHKTSHEFAKVCLMVFANGARFVDDDERVFWPRDWAMTEEGKQRLKADTDGTIRYSGGWIYLRAIMRMGRSIAQGPNLYDFQTQVLLCAFLQGAAVPHLMWVLSGLGLRSAQEIGIHVRSTLMLANPMERALYNRAFWCLYHIDRVNCAAIGRSVALQDTDFDADYPIAVDDEYWDTGDPDKDFVQPEGTGVPKVAAFTHMLKLDHVLGAALRTIYAINKLPEHHADFTSQRAVVVELDSALNAWADSVPDGLRWDPTRADYGLFQQSAMLYSQYYLCQILIHRPFIPTPQKPETIGLPSLAICSNAARSIANILDALLRRGRQNAVLAGQAVNIHFLLPAWTAAVILLVSIYSGKQQHAERERAMLDVKRCIAATKEMEMTWRQAGKLTDVLMELASERMDGGVNGPPAIFPRHGTGMGTGKRAAGAADSRDEASPHNLSRVTSRSDLQAGSAAKQGNNVPRKTSSSTSLNNSATATAKPRNASASGASTSPTDPTCVPSRFAATFIDSPPCNALSPPPTPPNPWVLTRDPSPSQPISQNMYAKAPTSSRGSESAATAAPAPSLPPWLTSSSGPGSTSAFLQKPMTSGSAASASPGSGYRAGGSISSSAASPAYAGIAQGNMGYDLSRTSSQNQDYSRPQLQQHQHHMQQQQPTFAPSYQMSYPPSLGVGSIAQPLGQMPGPSGPNLGSWQQQQQQYTPAPPSQQQQQQQQEPSQSNSHAAQNEMLWDASFLDALGPELFSMGDVQTAGMDGGNTGGAGGENVDDLWAQLFGAGQGLWTPSIGQGGSYGTG